MVGGAPCRCQVQTKHILIGQHLHLEEFGHVEHGKVAQFARRGALQGQIAAVDRQAHDGVKFLAGHVGIIGEHAARHEHHAGVGVDFARHHRQALYQCSARRAFVEVAQHGGRHVFGHRHGHLVVNDIRLVGFQRGSIFIVSNWIVVIHTRCQAQHHRQGEKH